MIREETPTREPGPPTPELTTPRGTSESPAGEPGPRTSGPNPSTGDPAAPTGDWPTPTADSPGRGPSRSEPAVVHTADGDAIDGLVQRARGGDADAFASLYDLYAPRLHRYVRFRVREPSDAEDLVQRVFVSVLEALPRYEQRGVPFAAWLFRLAHNAVIDFGRTTRDHRPLDSVADSPTHEPGPAEAAVRSSELATLDAAIRTLTPDQQQVIACRFFAGLSSAETARVLGRREIAVRALQFRALGALRRRLAGSLDLDRLPLGEASE